MRKVFKKIIENLEEKIKEYDKRIERREGACYFDETDANRKLDDRAKGLEQAIEIVKQVAAEYNNGWIPCSKRLPERGKDVLVTVKYTGFMGMYGIRIKTGHMEFENGWFGDCAGGKVIAWQPLPEPYHPKGE
ncbi:MAG: DUF551 domain-containing protein [Lachnospiraceae bacterium]|nr:DUF551 domain-containing protein [Lachnospiraceae bacterium]MBP3477573.1 DUF551 domain-containing protein [Lachnospiraceae bacterium]